MTLLEVRELVAPLSDVDILALTLFGETRGEPIEGQIAVAQVIRNRVRIDLGNDGKPDWWGEGYRGVCLAPKQFSCWNDGDPTQGAIIDCAQRLRDGRPQIRQLDFAQLQWIADGVIRGLVVDELGVSTHYHADTIAPAWAASMILTAKKGHHVFYRER